MNPIFTKRNCGVSRFSRNSQYNCTITSIDFFPHELMLHIDVRGNGSLGPLQFAQESKLFMGNQTIRHNAWVPSLERSDRIVGYFTYDTQRLTPGAKLNFQFGQSGYTSVCIINSIPSGINPVNKFSMNLGGVNISVNTPTNSYGQNSYGSHHQIPPTPSYNPHSSQSSSYQSNQGYIPNSHQNYPSPNHSYPPQSYPPPNQGYPQSYPPPNQGYPPHSYPPPNQSYPPQSYPPPNQSYPSHQGYNPNSHQGYPQTQYRQPQKSQIWGSRHIDTRSFDNIQQIPTHESCPVREIKIWGSRSVNGIQMIYHSTGATPLDVGNHDSPMEYSLVLNNGEYITGISGRYGTVIDYIEITTSQSRSLRVGGNGGGTSFQFHAPNGSHIVGFYGGVGGHLHNLGVYSTTL